MTRVLNSPPLPPIFSFVNAKPEMSPFNILIIVETNNGDIMPFASRTLIPEYLQSARFFSLSISLFNRGSLLDRYIKSHITRKNSTCCLFRAMFAQKRAYHAVPGERATPPPSQIQGKSSHLYAQYIEIHRKGARHKKKGYKMVLSRNMSLLDLSPI